MRLAALLVLLSACAHTQQTRFCWSPCGVRLSGSDDCAGYARAEAEAVRDLFACARLAE